MGEQRRGPRDRAAIPDLDVNGERLPEPSARFGHGAVRPGELTEGGERPTAQGLGEQSLRLREGELELGAGGVATGHRQPFSEREPNLRDEPRVSRFRGGLFEDPHRRAFDAPLGEQERAREIRILEALPTAREHVPPRRSLVGLQAEGAIEDEGEARGEHDVTTEAALPGEARLGELGQELGRALAVPRSLEQRRRGLARRRAVRRVPSLRRALGQTLARELANGGVEDEAIVLATELTAATKTRHHRHEVLALPDRARGIDGEGAGEDRELTEHRALTRREKGPRPFDGGAQGRVARRGVAPSRDERGELRVEAAEERLLAELSHLSRRELDGQGQAVDAFDDEPVGLRVAVISAGGGDPILEEGDSLGGGELGPDVNDALSFDGEGLARGHEQRGPGREPTGDQRGDDLDDLLRVVEHDEPFGGDRERASDAARPIRRFGAVEGDLERRRDRRHGGPLGRRAREIAEDVRPIGGDLERAARLARTAGTDERDEASACAESLGDGAELGLPAEEPRPVRERSARRVGDRERSTRRSPAVAVAVHDHDVLVRAAIDLRAKPLHRAVHRLLRRASRVSPDLDDELLSRDHPPGVTGEISQEIAFLGGQPDALAPEQDHLLGEVGAPARERDPVHWDQDIAGARSAQAPAGPKLTELDRHSARSGGHSASRRSKAESLATGVACSSNFQESRMKAHSTLLFAIAGLLVPALTACGDSGTHENTGSGGGATSGTGVGASGAGGERGTGGDNGTGGAGGGGGTGGSAAGPGISFLDLAVPVDLTPDGKTALLEDIAAAHGDLYFYDTSNGQLTKKTELGDPAFDLATGISADGHISAMYANPVLAGLWAESGGWMDLGTPYSAGCDVNTAGSWDLSASGQVVVGMAWDGCTGVAFRWTQADGMKALDVIGTSSSGGAPSNRATKVSDDGQVAGGFAENGPLDRSPAIWKADGSGVLLDPTEQDWPGEVLSVSADGSVVAGTRGYDGFFWTEQGGMVSLGKLSTAQSLDVAYPNAVVAGGELIFGGSGDPFMTTPVAFVWTKTDGMRPLQDVATANGVTLPTGYLLVDVLAASSDGSVVLGTAYDASSQSKSFVLRLPTSAYGLAP